MTDYRISNDPVSVAEDNHSTIALGATALAGVFGVAPPINRVINHVWNLTPPPGNPIELPAGAPSAALTSSFPYVESPAHSMVNVLNQMANYYAWYGRLPGNAN